MIPTPSSDVAPLHRLGDDSHRVLVVIKDVRTRQSVLRQLQQAAFHVTTVPSLAVVDILSDPEHSFDLLVTAQSQVEMAQFGLPQLARSIDPELPILLLDTEAAHGDGIGLAAIEVIERWPLPHRPTRRLH